MTSRLLAPLALVLACYSPIGGDATDAGWDTATDGGEDCTGWGIAAPPAEECQLGSTGCECSAQLSCDVGLVCKQGFCGPCPAGQIDCSCEARAVCDDPWVCVDGMCY